MQVDKKRNKTAKERTSDHVIELQLPACRCLVFDRKVVLQKNLKIFILAAQTTSVLSKRRRDGAQRVKNDSAVGSVRSLCG